MEYGRLSVLSDGFVELRGVVVLLLTGEGLAGKVVDALWIAAMAKGVVEEEVVELVGPNKVFCLLLDIPMVVGWCEFGTDGCVDDVEEGVSCRRILLCYPADEMADKGLRDGAVDVVHGHVVGIVGAPAEGEFAEVACADDESTELVGYVHEYLGAFACLSVFVGDIVVGGVVSDVGKVLEAGFADGNFATGDSELLHEGLSVVVGAVCGAETRHGDADDVAAAAIEPVHGSDADEECECGVEPAADSNDEGACIGVYESLCECGYLDVENFMAALVECRSGGDEGVGVYGSVKAERGGFTSSC